MLFQLVITLVLLSIASAAAHLRGEVLSEDVPMNQALFDRYAAHSYPKMNATRAVTREFKKGRPAGMDKLLSSGKQALDFPGSFFVTRKYRTGDCSGAVTEMSGIRVNTCVYNIYGQTYSHRCTAGDEDTVPHTKKWGEISQDFDSGDVSNPLDCTYNYYTSEDGQNNEGNKCEIDTANIPYHGYQMSSASCGESFPTTYGPGLLSLFANFPGCYIEGNPAAFRFQPFGVCELFVDHRNNDGSEGYMTVDENTDFFYMKKVSCGVDGKVLVHAYSDPACSRKLFRGYMNMHQLPMFEGCDYDHVMDMTGTMMCTGGSA